VLAYISHSLYITYNYDINGVKLGCIDTIKNILGIYIPNIKKAMVSFPKLPRLPRILEKKKEVFNIDQNIFTYKDAIAICKAYDAELATHAQVHTAYKNNGNWCNYGWTKSKDNKQAPALFITQKSYYDKLQKGPLKNRNNCGKPGINGGYFDDLTVKFGANCYGVKPDADPSKIKYEITSDGRTDSAADGISKSLNPTTEDINNYKKKINNRSIELRPFNNNKWSRYSNRNSTYNLSSDKVVDIISTKNNSETKTAAPTTVTKTDTKTDVL